MAGDTDSNNRCIVKAVDYYKPEYNLYMQKVIQEVLLSEKARSKEAIASLVARTADAGYPWLNEPEA